MTDTVEKLKPTILALSEAERWELIGVLFDSLPAPPGVMSATDPDFIAELDRRRAEFESGADPGIPADEFFRKLRENRR